MFIEFKQITTIVQIVPILTLSIDQLSNLAIPYILFQRIIRRPPPSLITHLNLYIMSLRGLDDLDTIIHRCITHGHFDVDMFAGFEGCQGHFAMQIVRGTDHHNIDVFVGYYIIIPREGTFQTMFLGTISQGLLIDITAGDQIDLLHTLYACKQINSSHPYSTHYTHSQPCHNCLLILQASTFTVLCSITIGHNSADDVSIRTHKPTRATHVTSKSSPSILTSITSGNAFESPLACVTL